MLDGAQRALSLESGYAEAEVNGGIALTLAGLDRHDDAIARSRAALELEPRSAEAHLQLVLALHQTGRRDEAKQHAQADRQLGVR